ncbi:hypothetical protein HNQ09_000719 [Deinococcus budaensis]|uniref:Uncharacterized protein n=1 Tax=Deinococcus budaensis TaxID=1665626 RepID=A0A7W8LP62_9DEIO|nr:hypothetical protein [Deinococcus budaensis]
MSAPTPKAGRVCYGRVALGVSAPARRVWAGG